jgi:ParB-like chromosome segregation protein Spo0J
LAESGKRKKTRIGKGREKGISFEIRKIRISDLVPHEGTIERHIRKLRSRIEEDGYLLRPIAVSSLSDLGGKWKGKYMIHDGHHRTAALKRLGSTRVMASVFDFKDPRIRVFRFYRTNIPVPKEKVIERAISGKEVTPRFDKHYIISGKKREPFHDNPKLEPKLQTPLSKLR